LTGATGFLGSNIVKKLIQEHYHVIILKRSFSNTYRINDVVDRIKSYDADRIKLEDVFRKNNIDTIVHCATDYGREDIDPLLLMQANLTLPLQLLELGRKNGVSCFVNTDTILDKRVSYYSLSKNQFRDWLEFYAKEMICINVALEHFYGPYDNNTKFVSFIIDSILQNAKKIDLTEGRQKRDFIYIDDVVSAFMAIIKNKNHFKKGFLKYEIGTGDAVEIRQFVRLVKDIAKNNCTELNFGAIPYRKNETMNSKADLTEICKLNWEPKFTLEKGLSRTITMERTRIN